MYRLNELPIDVVQSRVMAYKKDAERAGFRNHLPMIWDELESVDVSEDTAKPEIYESFATKPADIFAGQNKASIAPEMPEFARALVMAWGFRFRHLDAGTPDDVKEILNLLDNALVELEVNGELVDHARGWQCMVGGTGCQVGQDGQASPAYGFGGLEPPASPRALDEFKPISGSQVALLRINVDGSGYSTTQDYELVPFLLGWWSSRKALSIGVN
jgi:hypothetical protein